MAEHRRLVYVRNPGRFEPPNIPTTPLVEALPYVQGFVNDYIGRRFQYDVACARGRCLTAEEARLEFDRPVMTHNGENEDTVLVDLNIRVIDLQKFCIAPWEDTICANRLRYRVDCGLPSSTAFTTPEEIKYYGKVGV